MQRKMLPMWAVAAAGVITIAAACGGNGNGANTDGPNEATGSPATEAASAAAESTSSPAISLVAKDIAFDQTSIEAAAGAVTINLDNQDRGIPHNIHVFRGDGPGGESIDMTEIAAGPVNQSLTVQLQAGGYFFDCDVHPNQMTGTLVVR